jgi:hydroxyethylthiazole kinase-like uncharacterized protein yjeF
VRIVNAAQMAEARRRATDEIGLLPAVLMENAARQVVAAMEARFENLARRRVAVLCGRGRNGAHGFVVARTLADRQVDVGVFLLGELQDLPVEARRALDSLATVGVTVVEIPDEPTWELHVSEIVAADLLVDAVLGTGCIPPLAGVIQTVAADVNASGIPVVAVDLPTGVSADSPQVSGEPIRATVTVALGAPKIPLIFPPAEACAGDIVIADIGIPPQVLRDLGGPHLELLVADGLRPLVQPRARDAHKGDFGRVLIVAGSVGRTGAAHLAAMGALRSGAGLVTVATPRSCQPVVAALGCEYLTEPLDETPTGTIDYTALDRVLELPSDVIALGPGLGTNPATAAFVHGILEAAPQPLVLDADALTVLADDPDRLTARRARDLVITPHPGEMGRLIGQSADAVQAERVECARRFATRHRAVVILKGYRTLVATPSGKVFVNPTGNPGLATGGTGDILTGMVAAWLAQLRDAEAASKLAVYLHGLAGDLAEDDEGEVAMTASDVVGRLGDAVRELTGRRPRPAE